MANLAINVSGMDADYFAKSTVSCIFCNGALFSTMEVLEVVGRLKIAPSLPPGVTVSQVVEDFLVGSIGSQREHFGVSMTCVNARDITARQCSEMKAELKASRQFLISFVFMGVRKCAAADDVTSR